MTGIKESYGPFESVKSQYKKRKRSRLVGKPGTHPVVEVKLIQAKFIIERIHPSDKTY